MKSYGLGDCSGIIAGFRLFNTCGHPCAGLVLPEEITRQPHVFHFRTGRRRPRLHGVLDDAV